MGGTTPAHLLIVILLLLHLKLERLDERTSFRFVLTEHLVNPLGKSDYVTIVYRLFHGFVVTQPGLTLSQLGSELVQ